MSEEIRVGDRFLLDVVVRGGPDQHASYAVTLPEYVSAHAPQVRVPEHFLQAGKRLPRPLRVGDRVSTAISDYPDEIVIHIDGDLAWCRSDRGSDHIHPIIALTLAEESAS